MGGGEGEGENLSGKAAASAAAEAAARFARVLTGETSKAEGGGGGGRGGELRDREEGLPRAVRASGILPPCCVERGRATAREASAPPPRERKNKRERERESRNVEDAEISYFSCKIALFPLMRCHRLSLSSSLSPLWPSPSSDLPSLSSLCPPMSSSVLLSRPSALSLPPPPLAPPLLPLIFSRCLPCTPCPPLPPRPLSSFSPPTFPPIWGIYAVAGALFQLGSAHTRNHSSELRTLDWQIIAPRCKPCTNWTDGRLSIAGGLPGPERVSRLPCSC